MRDLSATRSSAFVASFPKAFGERQGECAMLFRFAAASMVIAAAISAGISDAAAATAGNDYPTEAVADYVFGCMKANGETREALRACSCSADVVASILPYDRYVEASTFLSMMQLRGEGSDLFRSTAEAHASVQDLRRAQAEGEVRCFNSVN
jgi:hypothetical protein